MNYTNTFIAVSPDTKAKAGVAPPMRAGKPSIAQLEYELLAAQPYQHTQEEVQFAVHVQRLGLTPAQLKTQRKKLWAEFFSKPIACMRTSPLARTYGWGLHFNGEGKVALVAMESADYRKLAKSKSVLQTCGMRSTRA